MELNRAEKIERLRQRALTDFFFFCKVACGNADMAEHPHRLMCEFAVQPDPLKSDKHRSLILASRSHMKTTIFTVCKPLYMLVKNPYHKHLLGSYTFRLATGFLRQIKAIIDTPDEDYAIGGKKSPKLFRTLFGDLNPHDSSMPWNEEEIQVLNWMTGRPVPFTNMPSIRVMGADQQKASIHPTGATFDDLVDEKTAKSEKARETAWEFVQFVEPLVDPGGMVDYVGTRYHDSDIYGRMIERFGDKINQLFIPCFGTPRISPPSITIPERSATLPAWPERFTTDSLNNIKIMMDSERANSFASQYLLNPWSEELVPFQKEWIRYYELAKIFDGKKYLRNLHVTMTVDLNAEGISKRDDAAITVVGTDCMGRWFILDALAGEWDWNTTESQIITTYKRWPDIRFVAVEANNWQAQFSRGFQHTLQRLGMRMPLLPLTRNTRKSKEERIKTLISKLSAYEVFFQDHQNKLLDQMLHWMPGASGKDDLLDSLADHMHPDLYRKAALDEAGLVAPGTDYVRAEVKEVRPLAKAIQAGRSKRTRLVDCWEMAI